MHLLPNSKNTISHHNVCKYIRNGNTIQVVLDGNPSSHNPEHTLTAINLGHLPPSPIPKTMSFPLVLLPLLTR